LLIFLNIETLLINLKHKFFDTEIDTQSEHIAYYKKLSRMSNSTEDFLVLANLYLLGDQEAGVLPGKINY
jgi:hypothetical protein